jgi:general secretion pathway protein K
MWVELHSADNLKNSVSLGCIAKSGSNFALAVLEEDASSNDFDSIHDIWSEAEGYSAFSTSLFDKGHFMLKIMDLSGKIQINKLIMLEDENWVFNLDQQELLARFLSLEEFDLESGDIESILEAIKDWIDPDDQITGFGGAESSYYESLEKPYSCRNSPFKSIEELILVKGITREIFYGTDDKPGISDFLTVFGDGKININTAHAMVFKSLSEDFDQEMIDDLIAYRENEENDLSNIGWYKIVLNTQEDYIKPDLINTVSNHFEIESIGIIEDRTKAVSIIVERVGKTPNILSWKYL